MDETCGHGPWGRRQSRTLKLLGLMAICFALLTIQVARRQLVEGRRLAQQALAQRAQEFPLAVARGEILDRNGISLTGTTYRYSAVVFPTLIHDKSGTAASIAAMLGVDRGKTFEELLGNGPPVVIAAGLTEAAVGAVRKAALPGVIAVREKVRYGPESMAHHLVGYINNALDNQGQDGLEREYDRRLRGGRPEAVQAFVDANRQPISGLGLRVQLPGEGGAVTGGPQTVVTTIDARIQRIVEEVMDEMVPRGAVVIVDPRTGDILAMASRPDFDPNDVGAYLHSTDSPLVNRAVKGYPPGSVFKVVTAAAALEAGVARPTDVFEDPGYIDLQGHRYRCYKEGGHGRLSFAEAMALSCNPVFIEVGERVGSARLVEMARRLGFGARLGLPLGQESPGNVPDEGAGLYDPNLSIGQGALLVTPVQVAQMMTAVANNGVVARLRLIKEIDDAEGVAVERGPEVRLSQAFSWLTGIRLRSMLRGVVLYGTGTAAEPAGTTAAGKTGSAETGRIGAGGEGVSHAWFAGYAPASNPRLVVTVFVEEGRAGGKAAAPVFKRIVERALPLVGSR